MGAVRVSEKDGEAETEVNTAKGEKQQLNRRILQGKDRINCESKSELRLIVIKSDPAVLRRGGARGCD